MEIVSWGKKVRGVFCLAAPVRLPRGFSFFEVIVASRQLGKNPVPLYACRVVHAALASASDRV